MRTILTLTALVAAIGVFGANPVSAQAVDSEWAQQFVGSWAVTLETPDGAMPMVVNVQEEAGKVTVRLGQGEQGRALTDVRRAGDALVANYDIEYQGMALPATLTLKPNGAALSTEWDFGGGMYTTTHEATKR